MKILIVDDSKAMRMIVKRTLKQAGFDDFEAIEAEDGLQALEMVDAHSPDLILSDWNMPNMQGIDLLRALRQKGDTTQLGFITSESGADIAKLAKDEGAAFIVTKPFSPQKFEAALSPILN